ncbi:unnamed protein product [Paramecium pentaurelia]|uniref:Uncharacterized protein n=1 Tax=Paramecium pentaurelia TaxID=43138 RepID=A0A8S1YCI9_9CILI|nr:unnamed protein product [Paramecium pentaurelia]
MIENNFIIGNIKRIRNFDFSIHYQWDIYCHSQMKQTHLCLLSYFNLFVQKVKSQIIILWNIIMLNINNQNIHRLPSEQNIMVRYFGYLRPFHSCSLANFQKLHKY